MLNSINNGNSTNMNLICTKTNTVNLMYTLIHKLKHLKDFYYMHKVIDNTLKNRKTITKTYLH